MLSPLNPWPRLWVFPCLFTLSNNMSSGPPKIKGGEYGEIRASIDIDNLNAYLSKHIPSIKAPVDVKQFKVSKEYVPEQYCLLLFSEVRSGMLLLLFS